MSSAAVDDDDRSDVARFETLYDEHFVAVSAYCRRRVAPQHVDDVVAETFLTAWRRIDDVPTGERGLFWLYRVAYRVVGHQWRGRSRRQRLEAKLEAVAAVAPATPEDDVIANDELHRVLEASARLNDRDAETLRLLAWEHLSRDAIAEVLDIKPNAVSQRIHRARANLVKEFARLERRPDQPRPDQPRPDQPRPDQPPADRPPTARPPAARKGGTP